MAHTPAYERFVSSMTITQEMWHDGIGYDVGALAEVTAEEAGQLVGRMRECGDWRDVEALAEMAGLAHAEAANAAKAALSARATVKDKVGLRAVEALSEMGEGDDGGLEDSVVETLLRMGEDDAFSQALDLSERFPSERVKRALLRCAKEHGTMGVHCAAMLYFHAGLAGEAFDWDHRPFFLRFSDDDPADRERAFLELCERVGMRL